MSLVNDVVVGAKGARAGLSAQLSEAKSNRELFFRVNPAGGLIYANDGAWALLRALGYRRQGLPEPFRSAIERLRAHAAQWQFEIACGEDTYSFLAAPGYHGYFFTFTGTRVDQTAMLRQTLSESQEFARSVAHDLRGPLRAIRALTEATLADCEPVLGANAEHLKRVTSAAIRMNRFLDDLLQLGKSSLQELEFQVVDVAVLLRDLVQERPQWQLPYADLQILSPSIPIRGDLASLIQSLSNLLSNAIKFVPPGIQPHVRVYSQQNGRHTKIFFEDNGIGIPKEDLPNLFKPLRRSRTSASFEGTGLGLAIVQTAIARMGGRVGVESEPGKGSRFWLELPTAEPPANGQPNGHPGPRGS